MRRAVLIALVLAACGDDGHAIEDAHHVDAPPDGAGSGSAMAMVTEPSPRDGNLEWVVAFASVGVVLGPVGVARRRSRDDGARRA